MKNSIFAKLLNLESAEVKEEPITENADKIHEKSLKSFLAKHWSNLHALKDEEVQELTKLQNRCLPGEKYTEETIAFLMDSTLVYKIDGKIVGGIILGRLSNTHPAKFKYETKKGTIECIFSLFVDDQYRGKGIGKTLLYAGLHGFEGRCIILHVRWKNKAAIELYKKVGFIILSRIHKYYSNPTEDAWEMVFVRDTQ